MGKLTSEQSRDLSQKIADYVRENSTGDWQTSSYERHALETRTEDGRTIQLDYRFIRPTQEDEITSAWLYIAITSTRGQFGYQTVEYNVDGDLTGKPVRFEMFSKSDETLMRAVLGADEIPPLIQNNYDSVKIIVLNALELTSNQNKA